MARKLAPKAPKKGQPGSAAPKHKVPAVRLASREDYDNAFSRKSQLGTLLRLNGGDYVSGEDLAAVLEAHPGQPLLDEFQNYLCRFLRGTVKKKRGPQKKPLYDSIFFESMASVHYQEVLQRLQLARKAKGQRIKGEAPPHELAAKFIKSHYKYFSHMSWQRISNILSSRKLFR